uniref:Uncharacterized protein n=1 Tax=Glossina austeni TaxID=7395 RepID=A0A1A9VJ97_GLOAU
MTASIRGRIRQLKTGDKEYTSHRDQGAKSAVIGALILRQRFTQRDLDIMGCFNLYSGFFGLGFGLNFDFDFGFNFSFGCGFRFSFGFKKYCIKMYKSYRLINLTGNMYVYLDLSI